MALITTNDDDDDNDDVDDKGKGDVAVHFLKRLVAKPFHGVVVTLILRSKHHQKHQQPVMHINLKV